MQKKKKYGILLAIGLLLALSYTVYQKYRPYDDIDVRHIGVFEINLKEFESIPILNLGE